MPSEFSLKSGRIGVEMRFSFGDITLDADRHELVRGGVVRHVEPQVFDVLLMLVEADGELVRYEDLVNNVWNGRIVSDATIAARISSARSAVGDSGKAQKIIRTIVRRGVQLVVPVQVEGARDNQKTTQGSNVDMSLFGWRCRTTVSV